MGFLRFAISVLFVLASGTFVTAHADEQPSRQVPRFQLGQPSLPFALQWHRSTFGTGVGRRGMEIVDLDGDGRSEVVATASVRGSHPNRFWYVLTFRDGEYVHEW